MSIPGCLEIASPTTGPIPFTRLKTPGGTPASCSTSAKRTAARGVISEGFNTTVHPTLPLRLSCMQNSVYFRRDLWQPVIRVVLYTTVGIYSDTENVRVLEIDATHQLANKQKPCRAENTCCNRRDDFTCNLIDGKVPRCDESAHANRFTKH